MIRFLLDNVSIKFVSELPEITDVLYETVFTRLNQHQFYLHIPETGNMYAENGNKVLIEAFEPENRQSIELYLNGSVTGAILHQRKQMPLHASSFQYKGHGIALSGDTGAGKSSITLGFINKYGASFLTDDITPILINNHVEISPIGDSLKLWKNALEQLNPEEKDLTRIRSDIEKFFYPLESQTPRSELRSIYFLQVSDQKQITIEEIKGADKFELIFDNIYRKEYLEGMVETKLAYFKTIAELAESVDCFVFKRPKDISIENSVNQLKTHLSDTIKDHE